MNARVLELLKNPKNIQAEDLVLLKNEINFFPYLQNVRALHLFGVHLYDPENYQKILSTTAAYTTDKKILYQLINGKTQPKNRVEEEETLPENTADSLQKYNASPNEDSALQNDNTIITEVKATEQVQEKLPDHAEQNSTEAVKPLLSAAAKHNYEEAAAALMVPRPEIKHVFVKGERNRILFEGEENFLEEDGKEIIDLESSRESGVIVTHKAVQPESENMKLQDAIAEPVTEDKNAEISASELEENIQIKKSELESENLAKKTNLPAEEISTENDAVEKLEEIVTKEDSVKNTESLPAENLMHEKEISPAPEKEDLAENTEVSFHATSTFLPDVKIQPNPEKNVAPPKKTAANKHEEEMRRLIAQVEERMKAKKADALKNEEPAEEIQSFSETNFTETQAFEISNQKIKEPEISAEESTEHQPVQEMHAPEISLPNADWKPMSFENNLPDALLHQKNTEKQPEVKIEEKKDDEVSASVEEPTAEIQQNIGTADEKQTEEEPIPTEEEAVMSVSFFGADISKYTTQTEEVSAEKMAPKIIESEERKPAESNVPGFINTWQRWLKIDRSVEIEKQKAVQKTKIIESFIENNPKISQLKDEVNFVVKEKNDDISHLMTETLANLYTEQKLYTKAVKAFHILIEKHPQRQEYFLGKIQEIKDLRNRG